MSNNKTELSVKNCFRKKFLVLFTSACCLLFLLVKYSIETSKELNDLSRSECLFCKIASGRKVPPILEFENDEYVIFKDKKPAAKHHYLAIPKQHFDSIKVLNKSHVGLVERMQNGMLQFLASRDVNLSDAVIGYHIPPFISQKHLHLHGISPTSEMGISDRISFMMPSFWFKSANDVLASLQRSEL